MFLTKTAEPWSLTKRLLAWFTLSAILLTSAVSGLLYWGAIRGFHHEDDQYLREKVNSLETLLKQSSDRLDTVRWEVEEESVTPSSVRLMARITKADGSTAFQTVGMEREIPVSLLRSLAHSAQPSTIQAPSGKAFRVLTREITNPAPMHLEVALDLGYEQQLLASFRDQLWTVLSLGSLAAIFIGYRIAKAGLAPLHAMTDAVRRVRSSTLGERLEVAGMPSEVAVLANTFNEMLEGLDDSFQRLSRFSSDLAHELRTPVGSIRGELEVLLSRARDPEEYRDGLHAALEACQRLARLIDRFLFLARAESADTSPHTDEVEVLRELENVLEFYEPAATERGVRLDLNVEAQLKATVDRTLFQVAIGNLIDNAIRYTPPGGLVSARAECEPGFLVVSVSDTGDGIAPRDLPHVFTRLYRGDPARAHSGGAGLGLAIVETIAKLHRGKVSIQSEVGAGTCVRLFLPA